MRLKEANNILFTTYLYYSLCISLKLITFVIGFNVRIKYLDNTFIIG